MSRSQLVCPLPLPHLPPPTITPYTFIREPPTILFSAYIRATKRAGPIHAPAIIDHDLKMHVIGVADWTPEDFNACAARYNLMIAVPEHELADGLLRREIFGWAGLVDMERVRCQLYVNKPGDLTMAQQLARLQNLGRA
ncbi:hypothetical protein MMC30_004753 [Trapelia coarctata]|nr:hypothetical protein [Trapelia coarctata]